MEEKKQSRSITWRYIKRILGTLLALLTINQFVYWAILPVLIFHPQFTAEAYEQLLARPDVVAVSIQTANGIQRGWQTGEDAETVLLYFGGRNDDCSSWLYKLQESEPELFGYGVTLLAVDYPTFGQSEGVISESAFYRFAEDVYAYAKETFSEAKVVAMGYSLGSAAAIKLAAEHPLDGLILVAPMLDGTSTYTASDGLLHTILEPLATVQLQNDERAPLCDVRPLLAAGATDQRTLHADVEKLADLFQNAPLFLSISGCGHGEYWERQELFTAIRAYLKTVADGGAR